MNTTHFKCLGIIVITLFTSLGSLAQDKGVLSGNFQSNFSVFVLDSSIGAYESPQYFSDISSSEAWLYLNYKIKGFDVAARYDLFNNSNLLNPTSSYSGHGLGFWQVKKSVGKLSLTAGSFYDQFGSGLVFRAFETRLLGLDYAIQGVHAQYDFNDFFFIKAFTGNQKGSQGNRFNASDEIIKGLNSEHIFDLGENGNRVTVGASAVNRTITRNSMNSIVAEIESYPREDKFDPRYNVYAFNGYMNFNLGNFTPFIEYNYKTSEAIRNETGRLEYTDGNIIYAGIGYAKNRLGKTKKGGIGVNVQYRRIDHFQLKVTPNSQLLDGFITYQPSLTRQAAYRLIARYNAPAQDYGEQGIQGDLVWTIKKGRTLSLNYSNIQRLDGEQLFREYFGGYEHKFSKKLKGKIGLQSVFYNQRIYEGKDSTYANVNTITPWMELTYKFTRRNSLRFEAQYLKTEQDLGSFLNAIIELNMSPHWSFSFSDMINVEPVRPSGSVLSEDIVHYWTIFGKYNFGTNSITMAYIRQVEGINCTGGICRLEPAFSGFRFTLTSNF